MRLDVTIIETLAPKKSFLKYNKYGFEQQGIFPHSMLTNIASMYEIAQF